MISATQIIELKEQKDQELVELYSQRIQGKRLSTKISILSNNRGSFLVEDTKVRYEGNDPEMAAMHFNEAVKDLELR